MTLILLFELFGSPISIVIFKASFIWLDVCESDLEQVQN